MSKKLIAILLTVSLFLASFGGIGVLAEENAAPDNETATVDNSYNKIHFYFNNEDHTVIDSSAELQEAVSDITSSAKIRGRSGEPTNSEIDVTVEFASDFMETDAYRSFSQERANIDSIEELRDFRQRLNAYSKTYHNELIAKNIDSLDGLEYSECEAIGYSPFVTLKMDIGDISTSALCELSEMETVEHISLQYEPIAESEATWAETLDGINAYDIVNNGTYTGAGIRIGVYEAGGICDRSNVNLLDKDITIHDPLANVNDHATNVTTILATIAPDAEFYVSNTASDKTALEWFIDQGCDIVNCSFGYYNNIPNTDETYTDGVKEYCHGIDGVYDYHIRAHFITVFNSAGNKNEDRRSATYNPQNKVTSPGYAYNVITVGGVRQTLVDSEYVWAWAPSASYVCSSPGVKPNVSAPITVNIPNIDGGGTSYSAPIVAASVALLMECHGEYLACPDSVLSVLTSTAQQIHDYSTQGNVYSNHFDEKVGAGIIDLERMLNAEVFDVVQNTNRLYAAEIVSDSIYLPVGTELQISLTWLISHEEENGTEAYVTDYNLFVLDSYGDLVAASVLEDSNVEMIRVITPHSGRYRIVVDQVSLMPSAVEEDWLALTYTYQ